MFPVLGKYITEMLEGRLSDELTKIWAWDRHGKQVAAYESMLPRGEMRDIYPEEIQIKSLGSK
jgi:hypothetical protein